MSGERTAPPRIETAIPGPTSRAMAERLARVECRNVTCLSPAPIFWARAQGANVWDVDGNRFVDLGGGFGVSNAGHAHPRVVEAIARQSAELLHAMGDVHPPAIKVELLEALMARYPGGAEARGVLFSSGSDAVEAALKTAIMATGSPGVVAFEGAYHGLSLGALDATWRDDFRDRFRSRLPEKTVFARYGDADDVLRAASEAPCPVGAVLVEPLQGRGGERVPPPGFLRELRRICDREGWLLVVDEIYTGFGRTGRLFACELEQVVPDLLCIGKGLASGMPISACLGRRRVMDAWPESTGEALHTQTFIGHPASAAAALASLAVIEDEKLAERSGELGARALEHLVRALGDRTSVREVRGLGLMIGIECDPPGRALAATRVALAQGVISLPSGPDGGVVSITPPLVIDPEALFAALDVFVAALRS